MRSPSRVRALILLAIVLDLRYTGKLVRSITREPQLEILELDGVPVEIVRPGGSGPWPAWLFVNGAHPERRREPVVTRLSRGLARAGYIVFVPDLPGLGEGTITARTLDAAIAVTDHAANHPDVRDGRVALIGASTGAGLALLAAGFEELRGRISVVAAVAPFADLKRMICLATTCSYEERGGFSRYEVSVLHRRVVARSLVAAIPGSAEQARLLKILDMAVDGADPIESLPHDAKSPESQAVLSLLKNGAPERFDALYQALPTSVLDLLRRLSPLDGCHGVDAPVEIVVPPSDLYFPLGEAHALARALPHAHLTVTATLDHTRPQLSVAHLRSLFRFDRFVMRGLRAAASDSSNVMSSTA